MRETTYAKPVDLPYLRLRFNLATEAGEIQRFLIQLEYNLSLVSIGKDNWGAIARFDHNPEAENGHDVTEEELHLDLLDPDGSKYKIQKGFPDVPLDDCPEYCENWLLEQATPIMMDFERRNNLDGRYYQP